MARERRARTDAEVIDELERLPGLADEGDPRWDDESYWTRVAYPYLAIAQIAGERRLREAVRPLLDRACFGDPGEIMRGLRHVSEAIMADDWSGLADLCIDAASGARPGTVLWAVDQLLVLDDERARPLLERLLGSEHERIRDHASLAVRRLDKLRGLRSS